MQNLNDDRLRKEREKGVVHNLNDDRLRKKRNRERCSSKFE